MIARDGWTTVDGPLGPVTLVGGPDGLRAVRFDGAGAHGAAPPPDPRDRDDAGLAPAADQLIAYLSGDRRGFDLPLELRGTPFDLRVWDELRRLPYGTTTTYTDLAAAVGRPDVVRAVA
ncbi:MAG: methylated-DNA--[protein]-cysteine S-methyltransferase, partial [Thermoleophilia bacterium]